MNETIHLNSNSYSEEYALVDAQNVTFQVDYGIVPMNISETLPQNTSAVWVSPADEFWK